LFSRNLASRSNEHGLRPAAISVRHRLAPIADWAGFRFRGCRC
jgi:hypothetical protein